MRPLRSLFIYLAVVFIGGALIAPWLYWLAQWGAAHLPALHKLAASPFHRYVNRSLLMLALIGLGPLLKQLGVKSWRDLGLGGEVGIGTKLFSGFALGFMSLAVVLVVVLAFGGRSWNSSLSVTQIVSKLCGAALTAGVVATLEEILFRGGIFGGLRRVFNWRLALVASSAVYALVHFLERVELHGEVTWMSGLQLLPLMLAGFGDAHKLVPGFFSLAVAGILLALAYQRTGGLHTSIGLHAGWIFWLKSYGILTIGVPAADVWFWGTGKLLDGWLAFIVLLLMLAVSAKFFWRKPVLTSA